MPASHLLTSLLAFNIGVELGQLLVLAVLIPALGLLFRYVVAERMGTIILSALVAHTAWHWMTERYGVLRQFRFQWPVIDAAFWVGAMRWAMLVVVGVGAVLAGLRRAQVRDESSGPRRGRSRHVARSGYARTAEVSCDLRGGDAVALQLRAAAASPVSRSALSCATIRGSSRVALQFLVPRPLPVRWRITLF